ncbi:polyprenol phosphomannose-dependent alpha 1,6 mannosyltransferase MptB [Pseudarthrobacter cellobiosi]|uniref:polyprenol phosphomannose-dependent alpha 1,6 mannosyltransferase MptB n=1 Tax=Pseudarthrobacter cellobiosi TaxID=2953654 RepID=UPI00208EA012|nr:MULTISPECIES: polyprenol phosphomannose-dependent alpha 1,6 mannosyltransferase MptB [unclassified Pseudarthrobacter]MCO4257108.1 polyprenol phosphomannose-dependent alpha 1,6 mannosyltransferase MptB [Pseudarthrobacter sp. HLT1-5]MCO4274214.1 polyprenol phosphomannose-dependent alpha 1,6 mannosyltransferase MptB [Pseudarthrobacter sp. HLT3-5]
MTAPLPATGDMAASVIPEPAAAQVDNARSPILAGLVGSVLMVFGSLGVGWLAPVSELRRVPIFIWMRTEAIGVALAIVLVAVGGMLLVRSWLRLGQRVRVWGPAARKATLQAIAAWGLPLMFTVPLFSRDVYAYIGQGRLMVEGFNPYENGISALSNYFQLGADKQWTEAPVPYGQLFLWIEQFVVWSTNVQPEASVMLFRLVALFGVVLCVIYVPKLAELHGVNPHRALWLTAANPLFLTNFIASVHNDALMIGLALAGLYYAATRRVVLGIVLVTLSIAVKPITIVFLPFIGLIWAGKNAGWPRKFLFWGLTGGLSLAILYGLSLVNGFGFGWINGLSAPGSLFIWYAPVGLVGLVVASVSNAFGLDGWTLADWVFDAGKILAVGIVAFQIFKGEHERLIRRLTLGFAAIVVLAPMIQAWYVVWLIPLFAVTGIRNDWQVKALYFIVSFFMIYAISDQLEVFPYLQTEDLGLALVLARFAAAITGLLFAMYLIFMDPDTKRLFRKSAEPVTERPVI